MQTSAALKRDSHRRRLPQRSLRISKNLAATGFYRRPIGALDHKGYIIVRQAVPAANVERLVDLLWRFDEKDPKDPSTWYAPQRREHKMKELNNTGMLEIYNHQHLWDNRMEQRVYDIFVDIWDREDLWVTIDRANLNPPKKSEGQSERLHPLGCRYIHPPLPIGVQGVLSLQKQDGDVGGFQCVRIFSSILTSGWRTQPEDRDPMHPDMTGLSIVNIDMEPGDLMIFNSLLAHGVRPNHSDDRVRMAQYISMHPAEFDNEEERLERIRLWKERDHPRRDAFPGDPASGKSTMHRRQNLTLGEKLLGLQRW